MDIIKSGGYKISALDVERHLLAHPDITGAHTFVHIHMHIWTEEYIWTKHLLFFRCGCDWCSRRRLGSEGHCSCAAEEGDDHDSVAAEGLGQVSHRLTESDYQAYSLIHIAIYSGQEAPTERMFTHSCI